MQNHNTSQFAAPSAVGLSATAHVELARAGGGGSSSGGSASDGISSGISLIGRVGHRNGDFGFIDVFLLVIVLLVLVGGSLLGRKRMPKRRGTNSDRQLGSGAPVSFATDPLPLVQRATEVFNAFQKAWSDMDANPLKDLLTDEYYRRMVLELNVLYNQKRRNLMEGVTLNLVLIKATTLAADGQRMFSALVSASAKDTLLDTEKNVPLFVQDGPFTETWDFRWDGERWKLDSISQATESATYREAEFEAFAKRNGFYYDPDFGWLMMPNKGVIFNATNFGQSDINNHVIGYYREKIVEFYSYRPDAKASRRNYVVAQAILPISYRDILVRRRARFFNRPPAGLQVMSLEWPDFNKKFFVCADPQDDVSTLELLTPNFMEKIEALPFELNIEIVGNTLYFYTEDRTASYDRMLEIMSWAFDEMRK